MIGQSEIHDFLRFAQNPGLGNQLPFVDQTASSECSQFRGFAQGEHRMLLADYNFVDPGVYARMMPFDIKDQYPDLDGDGIGEGHLIARVAERSDMDQCSEGPGKSIYIVGSRKIPTQWKTGKNSWEMEIMVIIPDFFLRMPMQLDLLQKYLM